MAPIVMILLPSPLSSFSLVVVRFITVVLNYIPLILGVISPRSVVGCLSVLFYQAMASSRNAQVAGNAPATVQRNDRAAQQAALKKLGLKAPPLLDSATYRGRKGGTCCMMM